jgi:SAM-dependent methyltransferase
MPIVVDGSSSSISGLTKHVRSKRRSLSANCALLPDFRKLADVCCCMGRHARALSSRGYSVIGVDRDADAIAEARELAGGPSYVHADIRDYRPEPGTFDVAIVMSQSFGYFDAITNRDVLGILAARCEKAVVSFSICGTRNS